MDRGAWQAVALRGTQNWTQLKRLCMHAYMLDILEETMDFGERLSRYSFLLDMVKTQINHLDEKRLYFIEDFKLPLKLIQIKKSVKSIIMTRRHKNH